MNIIRLIRSVGPATLVTLVTLLALVTLVAAPALAATPRHLDIVGAIRSAGGGPVPDGKYAMVFALYDCADTKSSLFKEFDIGVPVAGGRFHHLLGLSDAKNQLDPLHFRKQLCIGVAIQGGSELPTVPIGSTAYTFAAQWAESASKLDGPLDGSALVNNSVAASKMQFTYAASSSKGGPATAAESVKCSGCIDATQLKNGAVGDEHVSFKFAAADKKGGAALHALDLLCTGCVQTTSIADEAVTLAKLAKDVAAGFVKTKGGTLAGDLDVSGHQLVNMRTESINAAKVTCNVGSAGRLFFDPTTQKLTFCDGSKNHKLAICAAGTGCKAPAVVPCGEKVTDLCGDPTCGDTKGIMCKGEQVCAADKCIDAALSCADWLKKNPKLTDGDYLIDIDGAGGFAPFKVWCDMQGGGYTLAFNMYDSIEDDVPNTVDYYGAGWQQVKSGTWNKKIDHIRKAIGTAASAGMSPDMIRAMWNKGSSALKVCFVNKDGTSELCRATNSASANLTLTPAPANTTNSVLAKFVSTTCKDGTACYAGYTFGRLAGIPGDIDTYDYSKIAHPGFCIKRTPGNTLELGNDATGWCSHSSVNAHYGVWHGWGCGTSYRPDLTKDEEISLGGGCGGGNNPSDNVWGWRIYVK